MTKIITKREKFRFFPTKDQETILLKTFGCVRFVWNKHVEHFNLYDKANKTNMKSIKELSAEFEFLKEVPFRCLNQVQRNFDQFKKQYFNKSRKIKLGKPKFKKKGKSRDVAYFSSSALNIRDGKFWLCKLGLVNTAGSDISNLPHVKSVTVIKEKTGKYYISACYETEVEELPKTGKSIGVDLGLTHYIIDNQGNKTENPRFLKNNLNKLKFLQKIFSRTTAGSKRREKLRLKIAKLHAKIANQREAFLHDLSKKLVREFDFIAVEDLAIKNMMKNRKLSRAIADASWSKFIMFLEYKCKWYGKELHKIHKYFASSKTCSVCGEQIDSLPLSIRNWTCPTCGEVHDRDINAAKNILARAKFEVMNPVKKTKKKQ